MNKPDENTGTPPRRTYKGQAPVSGEVIKIEYGETIRGGREIKSMEIKPDTKESWDNIKKYPDAIINNTPQGQTATLTFAPSKYYESKDIPPQPLHRQARGYMKTTASLVGKDMSEGRSLFTLPSYDYDLKALKETLSQKTAITGNLLLTLWQANKNDKGYYVIDNLAEIANLLQIAPQDLKLYLIYLGGYQYPIIKTGLNKQGKRIISFSSDKLFYIKFNMRLEKGESEATFTKDERIGNNYVNFIRNRDIDTIDIMPSVSIQEELQGKGLGNVLTDDAFVAFCLDLSELAYKLFCFSGSNKPSFKIGFDKLIAKKYLNLEKQVYGVRDTAGKRKSAGQGRARVLKRIQEALKELLDKGHLVSWAYDEATGLFSWTYSNKIIKHKELLTIKAEPEALKKEQNSPAGIATGRQARADKTGHNKPVAIDTERQSIDTERQSIDTERQAK